MVVKGNKLNGRKTKKKMEGIQRFLKNLVKVGRRTFLGN